MALKAPSLILYGYTVDNTNQNLDFQSVMAGPVYTAVIPIGKYNLSTYLAALASAMILADPANVYTVTANRSIAGGLQNRITISTSGAFLSLLFTTGVHAAASIALMAGFTQSDKTGATSYTGSSTTGTAVIPVMTGYNWVKPTRNQKVFGSVNVSATGVKEAIVFAIQVFFEVEFKYEPESIIDTVWLPFFQWAIQQQDLEFTPEITSPNTFYPATLESTDADSQGLGFMMPEMLPDFPGLYQTGKLKFRQNVVASTFI